MRNLVHLKSPSAGFSLISLHYGLDDRQARSIRRHKAEWKPLQTIEFILSVSLALWAFIGSLVWLAIRMG